MSESSCEYLGGEVHGEVVYRVWWEMNESDCGFLDLEDDEDDWYLNITTDAWSTFPPIYLDNGDGSSGWTERSQDITSYLTAQTQIRFWVADDDDCGDEDSGLNVDWVRLERNSKDRSSRW
ncbi:MAG: hypothetical protein R6V85_06000 [Polyangia bacterium]